MKNSSAFILTLLCFVQFSPDGVCQEQRQSFQTELLEFVMDIIHMTGQEEGQSTHVARDGKIYETLHIVVNIQYTSKIENELCFHICQQWVKRYKFCEILYYFFLALL